LAALIISLVERNAKPCLIHSFCCGTLSRTLTFHPSHRRPVSVR
jgi:hypothetical protein